MKTAAFEAEHGKGRPIITTEFKDWRFVAVGNELHYSKKDKTQFFPDFLTNYVRNLLGAEWGNAEIAKPWEERHQILKWYDSLCRYQRTVTPDPDGFYRAEPSGAMFSWYRLAYDLYLVKHNAALQARILNRLRHKDQFQGARFELCVAASMIVAGFEINFEDETDASRKHAEFIAKDSSGLQVAVEAKSRHRDGVLDYKSPGGKVTDKVSAERILRAAIAKQPDVPYFIFLDVNLPPSLEHPNGNPWFKEMAETMENLKREWEPSAVPANAVFFCNDPTHYVPDEVLSANPFWCYEVPIANARHPLPDPALTMRVAQAIIQRTNLPNEFPDS